MKFFLTFNFIFLFLISIYAKNKIDSSTLLSSNYLDTNIKKVQNKQLNEVSIVGKNPYSNFYNNNFNEVDIDQYKKLNYVGVFTITDFLVKNTAGITVNDVLGNPLQMELKWRGFTASPNLGIQQGIAVYSDGININDAFGDVIQWDLLPVYTIASLDVYSGSNPLFGNNASGGALSIMTKNGFDFNQNKLTIIGGSYGKMNYIVESGHKINNNLAIYVGADYYKEDGYRNYSPQQKQSFFTKITYRKNKYDWSNNIQYTQSDLSGIGPSPVELLAKNRQAIFTAPDKSKNLLLSYSTSLKKQINNNFSFLINTFYFNKTLENVNGDMWDNDGSSITDPISKLKYIIYEGSNDSFYLDQNKNKVIRDEKYRRGLYHSNSIKQNNYGTAFSLLYDKDINNDKFQLNASIQYKGNLTKYDSKSYYSGIDANRIITPSNLYDFRSIIDLNTQTNQINTFLTAGYTFNNKLTLSVTGQINYTNLNLKDNNGTALNGNHNFTNPNIMAQATYKPNALVSFYVNYANSYRNPTPIEVSCADENAPCRLPNAFASDPPLKQVLTQTYEIGTNLTSGEYFEAEAELYLSDLSNDIYFVAAKQRGAGYFKNIGQTRRMGFEVSTNTHYEYTKLLINYSYIEATFMNDFDAPGANNEKSDNGFQKVKAGNNIPLIPNHTFKVGIEQDIIKEKLIIGLNANYVSTQFLRGDEINKLDKLKDYWITNANIVYNYIFNKKFIKNIAIKGLFNNILDLKFETFGTLGNPTEVSAFSTFKSKYYKTPALPFNFLVSCEINF